MLGVRYKKAYERTDLLPRGLVIKERDMWVERLRAAIVKQTVEDLRRAIRWEDRRKADALCKWLLADWGQLLSYGQGEAIIRRVVKEEEEREQDDI